MFITIAIQYIRAVSPLIELSAPVNDIFARFRYIPIFYSVLHDTENHLSISQ